MNPYVTGAVVKQLRESKKLTQEQLAQNLGVSGKTISKWETGRGYPDITMLEPLAGALGISTMELLSGQNVCNRNRSGNMRRSHFYVCPICGNVVHATGNAVISCCGLTLPPLEAEPCEEGHEIKVEVVEDEYYVTLDHPMTKDHFISFLACLSDDSMNLVKLYPEGPAQARFPIRRCREIYAFCNKHGFYKRKP